MANIDLSKVFKNKNDVTSNVAKSILLNKQNTDPEYYSDVKLDLEFGEISESSLNADESNYDLKKIVNEESVITALRNILNTSTCTRLLNPDLAVNMNNYLFEPLTYAKAWFIAYDLCTLIPTYEPRVVISNVTVTPIVNDDSYFITLSLSIPSLSKNIRLSSILNSEGFVIGR